MGDLIDKCIITSSSLVGHSPHKEEGSGVMPICELFRCFCYSCMRACGVCKIVLMKIYAYSTSNIVGISQMYRLTNQVLDLFM